MEYVYSFAQCKEDIILHHLLKEVDSVFWIDAGANDPTYLSVSKFFSLRGGRGINIEPQTVLIEKYKTERPEDINLAVGVGEENGELILYGGGLTATIVPEEEKKYLKNGVKIPIVTLTKICEDYVPEEQNIHFLKIDIEGYEKSCLIGMDFKRFRPWILCIEAYSSGNFKNDYRDWEDILIDNDYEFVLSHFVNRYYVAKERKEILSLAKELDHLDEIYSIFDMNEFTEKIKTETARGYVNSRSWKITKPLRELKRICKK